MKFRLKIDQNTDEEIIARVHRKSRLTDEIERLVREDKGDTKITVYSEENDLIVEKDYNDIESVFVNGGKTTVVDLKGEMFVVRLKLYEAEEIFPECFIRINKSAIANKNRIARFEANFNGSVDVIFQSGYSDYVSRRCFADIKRSMKK